MKNEEIQNFIYSLKQMMQNVEVLGIPPKPPVPHSWVGGHPLMRCHQANSSRVQEDLEGEFQSLYTLLDELKEEMLMKIKQDRASRTYELQVSTHPACVSPPLSPSPTAVPVPSPGPAGGMCQGPGELGGAAGGGQPGPGDSQPP